MVALAASMRNESRSGRCWLGNNWSGINLLLSLVGKADNTAGDWLTLTFSVTSCAVSSGRELSLIKIVFAFVDDQRFAEDGVRAPHG